MKNVVITGVSTGIGKAAAEQLLGSGYRVFGSIRKAGAADELEKYPNFVPLIFDVTDEEAIQKARDQVKEIIGNEGLAALVNNAGIAVSGPLQHLDIEQLRFQFEVNVFGLMKVTQAFLPLLGAIREAPHPPGKIIQISSQSGKMSIPFSGAYVASKHALEGLSGSLRQELMLYGVDVIIVGPGPVKTAIWDKIPDEEAQPYKNTGYQEALMRFRRFALNQVKKALPAEKLGEKIKHIIENPKPRTRYVMVPNYFKDWWLPRNLLSDRTFDNIIAKRILKIK